MSIEEAGQWIEDTADLPDIMELGPDFSAVMEVEEFFDKNAQKFLDLRNEDVLKNPRQVNVMLIEASAQLAKATTALDNISASGLKFAEYYIQPYKEKLDTVMGELNAKRISLFDEAMRFLPDDTFGTVAVKKLYGIEEIDGEALKELQRNLHSFKSGMEAFDEKFNGIIDPNLRMKPCNNLVLAKFMSRQQHKEVFKILFDFIKEKNLDEMTASNLIDKAKEIRAELEKKEDKSKQKDLEEMDEIIAELEGLDTGNSANGSGEIEG